jgi:hypothetical protein
MNPFPMMLRESIFSFEPKFKGNTFWQNRFKTLFSLVQLKEELWLSKKQEPYPLILTPVIPAVGRWRQGESQVCGQPGLYSTVPTRRIRCWLHWKLCALMVPCFCEYIHTELSGWRVRDPWHCTDLGLENKSQAHVTGQSEGHRPTGVKTLDPQGFVVSISYTLGKQTQTVVNVFSRLSLLVHYTQVLARGFPFLANRFISIIANSYPVSPKS